MASLNFPDPSSTQTYTEAGLTWTWNATLGVWSSEAGSVSGGANVSVGENPPSGASEGDLWWNDSVDSYRLFIYTGTEWVDASPQGQEGSGGGLTEAQGDARYLSSLSDDTAAGAITFQGRTTHQDGIQVAGDHVVVNADKTGTARTFFGGGTIDTATTDCRLFYSAPSFTGTGAIPYVNHFQAQPTRPTGSTTITETTGFLAGSNLAGDNVTTAYGFYSDLGGNANTNYNFYAAGNASNFFQSYVITKGAFICSALDDWAINPPSDQTVGFSIRTSGNLLSYLGSDLGAYHRTVRQSNGELHRFGNDATAKLGAIQITAGALEYFKASDYRLKDNVADLGSAVDQVKNLRPVSYEMKTDPGYTQVGFLAHEVQQVVPQAVLGAKDAVETVGTLTTAEGDVESDVLEPEAIPYGSTWEATGTRDANQMMSQDTLIPILTKALQEALARIEELESNTLQPLYSTEADLPSASEHHGKTAHVHATGSLYFAHAGNWVKLQNA